MAEERIGYEDFFDKDLFAPVIKSIEDLIAALEKAENTLKDAGVKSLEKLREAMQKMKTAADVSAASVREFVKQVAEIDRNRQAVEKLTKEKERLAVELNKITTALREENKEYIKLKAAIKVYKDELKDSIKAQENLLKLEQALDRARKNSFESYNELAETLEVLRQRAKDLAAANKQNTDEYKEIAKLVEDLDERVKAIDTSLGQFQRLVGSYRESILRAFSEISFSAVGVQGQIGKFSVILIEVLSNSIKAEGGIKSLSSAIRLLGTSLKRTGVILALEGLIFVLQKIKEVFFPSDEEKLTVQLLKLQNELFGQRRAILERLLDYQAEIADLQDASLSSELQRAEIQQRIINLRLLELEATKANLAAEIELRRERLSNLIEENRTLGIVGKAVRDIKQGAEDLRRKALGPITAGIADAIDALAEGVRYVGSIFYATENDILNAQKELNGASERLLQIDEQIVELRGQQKQLTLQIAEIQKNALSEALQKLLAVEEQGLSSVQGLVKRYDQLFAELQKSYEDAAKFLGPTFKNELRVLEEEFKRRQDIINANFALELSQIADDYIKKAAEIVKQSLPALSSYVRTATELLIQDQAKALDTLISETKEVIALLEKQAELNKENAEGFRQQAEGAKALLTALERLRQSYQLNNIAELIRSDLQALQDYWKEQDRLSRLSQEALKNELLVRRGYIKERETQIEQERQLAEQGTIVDALLLRRKEINFRRFIEEEAKLQQERLDLERQIEEERIKRDREIFEQRKRELVERLEILKAEAAKYAETDIPVQLQSLINDLEAQITDLDTQLLALQNRSIEVAQTYLENTTRLALDKAKKYADLAKKEASEILQSTEAVLENINDIIKRRTEQRLKGIEVEKDLLDKTIDLLIARAEAGSLEADKSIADLLERKKAAELREQEIRRQQQRRELLLTGLQAYSAAIQRGSQAPLADAIRDLTALSQIIQSLPTFFEGTEYVSEKMFPKLPKVTKDALIARLHEGERIVPAHINKQLEGIKNEELPKLIHEKRELAFDFDSLRRSLVMILREKNHTKRYIERL